MKLEEILTQWDTDSQIDRTDLGESQADAAKLHSKYLRIFTEEKMRHVMLLSKMKRLKLAKYEHYTQGASKESVTKGWQLPPRGMVLKTDAPMYLDADEDMDTLQNQIDMAQVKIEALEMILRTISNRNYAIKNMIDWARWTGGA